MLILGRELFKSGHLFGSPGCYFSFFAVLAILLSGCSEPASTETRPPNIVMILADDQGWGDLSSSGNTNLSTPNIDRLAVEGASFSRFFVSPVCSPTRAEMLTGRYHPRGGVFGTSAGGELLDLDEQTIAEVFQEAGFATGAFGKWHNGMQPPYHPNARGFDEFYGFCSGHWGDYFSPNLLERNGELVKGSGYVTDDFTDHALAFIDEHQDQPFFAYLPFNTPHSPMQVPDAYWDKFSDVDLKMRHRDPDGENLQHTRAALAMVENIDYNVGRVLEHLEELGLEENTIVIYFSDNGPNGNRWNGGMKGRKGSTDEGGVRSPFYIRWKGVIEAGREINEIAGAIDLLPTLANLAGIPFENKNPIDGVNLDPLLLGEESLPDRYIFSYWNGRTSVRSQQYRLGHEDQLFDMVNDPEQRVDVSSDQPEIFDAMQAAKAAWQEDVLADFTPGEHRPFPVGYPGFELTQLPIRDATATGAIERSNRYPNDSYFLNWTNPEDEIHWDVDVLSAGNYEVVLYYACPEKDLGATIELRMGDRAVSGMVAVANDPPIRGAENDRDPRQESYVKDFKPMTLGTIQLEEGSGTLRLRALDMPGSQVMEVRLALLRRV